MNLHIENNNIHVNHDGPDGPQGFSLNGKANITEVHCSIVDGALFIELINGRRMMEITVNCDGDLDFTARYHDGNDEWEHGDGNLDWLYISCEKCNDSKRIELNPCDDIVLTHPNSFPSCSAYATCECTGQRKIVIQ